MPAAQVVVEDEHEIAPVVDVVPNAQLVHAVELTDAEYLPIAQKVHEIEPGADA